ncbi:MAG: oxidoreductase [Rhodospirillales bacterium]|nr:oxidoreductase [Rhodospirillales bacterium]
MTDQTTTAYVEKIIDECKEIKSFILRPSDPSVFQGIEAGAHIDLHIQGYVRQYSLCNGPDERDILQIAVKKEPGSRGGSRAVHETIDTGDGVTISGPRNNFPLAPDAEAHLLIAGGIGITPLLSMARYLGAGSVPYRLVYFARSWDHVAFREELETGIMREHTDIVTGLSPEETSRELQRIITDQSSSTHIYACGPQPLLDTVKNIAGQERPSATLHFEYFSKEPAPPSSDDRSFDVVLQRSGKTFNVPADKSIAAVLHENGIDVPVSCEQGICGTCLTTVIEGEPDHRDEVLSDDMRDDGDLMALCVSRAKGDKIVIDL